MIISAVKELFPGEKRVALLPFAVERLIKKGATVQVESGIGTLLGIDDNEYSNVGAQLTDRNTALSSADLIVRVRKPAREEFAGMKRGAVHVSFLDPFNDPSFLSVIAQAGVTAISVEMIPRTTLAQKMDALSSQANLAGYAAVIMAAERSNKIFPMMMTPAGTIAPSRVFVIGAGVSGLQAIATARRLGARVEAFDTRSAVEEQVQSLGAKFLKIDLGETGQTKDGYAKALSPEQLEKQREGILKACQQSDIVITTAQVFGRRAPRILTAPMIASLRPGTIVVDGAIESGGNVEGALPDQEVTVAGVLIIAPSNLPSHVAVNASQMYASNLVNLIEHFWNNEEKTFKLDLTDEILKACVLTHNGEVLFR